MRRYSDVLQRIQGELAVLVNDLNASADYGIALTAQHALESVSRVTSEVEDRGLDEQRLSREPESPQ